MSKKLKSVCVVGHFAEGKNLLNGQTIKTKILTSELERSLGEDEIYKIDTHGGAKVLLKMPFVLFGALKKSKNVIILPAHNGIKVIAPLLLFFNRFFNRKLHYSVIGGWLPKFLKTRKQLTNILKKFDSIYVETTTMKKALEEIGFNNICVIPNCKDLKILSEDELSYQNSEPYKLCTFSRVTKEKGIDDAVKAVRSVNEKNGRVVYTLDIYGQVDSEQTEWFNALKENFPEYIKYGGLVPFDKSVDVIKDYFALLFPTRSHTEGIPGTVIDAYAAGVPVISARWDSYSDVVDEGITGVGYEFDNFDQLEDILLEVALNPQVLINMKKNCICKAKNYIPESAMKIMIQKIRV